LRLDRRPRDHTAPDICVMRRAVTSVSSVLQQLNTVLRPVQLAIELATCVDTGNVGRSIIRLRTIHDVRNLFDDAT